uniref:Putative ovule protein n=1 Tax=Solanum chacoense TaxID=4108 RepID=A0A0V0GPL2_SOLCH
MLLKSGEFTLPPGKASPCDKCPMIKSSVPTTLLSTVCLIILSSARTATMQVHLCPICALHLLFKALNSCSAYSFYSY